MQASTRLYERYLALVAPGLSSFPSLFTMIFSLHSFSHLSFSWF